MMTETMDKKKIIFRVIFGLIILVWSFIVIDEGFYMDESGMLSIYRGIYQGNRMFIDAWGAHQFGAFLVYPFIALYYQVLEPIVSPMGCGFVLFMRICYQIVRLIVSVYVYFTIRKAKYEDGAFVGAITYYMFFLNFKNFSYKSMCEMSIMLLICWMFRYFTTKNVGFMILSALATCGAILAYPSMILFPVLFVIYLLILSYNGYELIKPTIIYCITCFICGIAVVLYLQFTSGIGNIIPQLQYTMDAAYKHPLYIREGIMLLSYLFFAVVAFVPIIFFKILSKYRSIEEETIQFWLSIYWIVFMAAVILMRVESVSTTRYIYGLLVVFFWYIYYTNRSEHTDHTVIGSYKLLEYDDKMLFRMVLFVSVCTQFIWSMTTNQEVTVPGHMAIFPIVLFVAMIETEFEGFKLLRLVLVLGAIYFMGLWVAESDGGYNSIFEARYYVTEGGYKGIALDEFDYRMNQSCNNLISQYVTPEDNLYVVNSFGTTAYLDTDAKQASGSPFSRVGLGQNRVLEYWETNPENQADYVLIDKANKYYEDFLEGETAKYIFENYTTTVATDGDVVLLSR